MLFLLGVGQECYQIPLCVCVKSIRSLPEMGLVCSFNCIFFLILSSPCAQRKMLGRILLGPLHMIPSQFCYLRTLTPKNGGGGVSFIHGGTNKYTHTLSPKHRPSHAFTLTFWNQSQRPPPRLPSPWLPSPRLSCFWQPSSESNAIRRSAGASSGDALRAWSLVQTESLGSSPGSAV